MSTRIDCPVDQPTIVMSRIYDAPRDLVWQAITDARHVRQWWGGAGVSNPVCDMDVRPGGRWTHVMRFADGRELHLDFVFLEVEKPERLIWQHADHDQRRPGLPVPHFTATLEDLGARTRWTLVARFDSLAARDAALAIGFTGPIAASNDRFADYLATLQSKHRP